MPTPYAPTSLLRTRPVAAGHWRAYAEPLAEPFALLSDVAQAFGYPAN